MIPDLTRTERRVFSAVYGHPHSSLTDLAELLGLDRSRVTRVVYRLERIGLIVTDVLYLAAEFRLPPVRLRVCRPADWTVTA